nr:hypothetical protein [Bacteroidota bacterium]
MSERKDFTLIEVSDQQTKREFLNFPSRLYKHEKNWIRPLDQDIEAIFDKKKNKLFRQGEAIRWILKDDTGKTIGRVAVFYNKNTASANDQPTGGMGFFDCIDNREAAFYLFDASKKWLEEKGMEAMEGPICFGERDSFWGCLVDGFTEPLYNMPYNFPYYQELFESYGFQNYFNQYTYHRKIEEGGISPLIREKAERVFGNPDYSFEMISWKNNEKFAEDFMTIYNKGWARFTGVKKITKTHALALLKKMRPVMDTRLVYFAYYKDEPVAFFIMMPDIYQIIRKLNGKFGWIQKLLFLYHLRVKKTCTRIIGRIFGIVPEHQGKGLEAGLVLAFEKVVLKPELPYTDLELNWIGDFNPAMMKVCEQIGSRIYKTHVTYRYLFDRDKPFKRARRVN